MHRTATLILLLVGLTGTISYAQEREGYGQTRGAATAIPAPYAAQRGFAGYLGLNAGYTAHNDDLNVEGAPGSIKLLGSYVTPEGYGVFDLGYGVQTQKFSNDDAMDKTISSDIAEAAARYQFENRWQLGAVYNQFFKKGENYGANQDDAQFAGLQLLREFGIGENTLGRVGARVMTSVNVNGNNVNMAMIDFQMGWGQTNRAMSTTSTY